MRRRLSGIGGMLWYSRRKPRTGVPRVLWLLLALAVLLCAYSMFNTRIRPLMIEMAEARTRNAVTGAINSATNMEALNEALEYNSLVVLEKDEEGRVAAIQTQMSAVNHLKAVVSDCVIEQISQIKTEELSIPIGSIMGGDLLSGRGPEIPVKILTVSSVRSEIENVFTSAGINQTRHQIILNVYVDISILLQGDTISTEVWSQISVAETVIVGSVPDSYVYFESDYDKELAGETIDAREF